VDQVTGTGWTAINVGDPFAWTVTFEPATPNALGCPAGSGSYFGAITGATLALGQYSWASTSGSIEANAPGGSCGPFQTGVTFRQFGWVGAPAGSRMPFEVVGTLFYPFLSDGTLPTIPPPSAFVQVNGPIASAGGPGSMTSVAPVPIPEPATLTLVASGAALLIERGRRRRKRRQPSTSC
jgi:hypothetical protein